MRIAKAKSDGKTDVQCRTDNCANEATPQIAAKIAGNKMSNVDVTRRTHL